MGILVRKKGWQADTVKAQPIGTLKDLGYYLDTDLGGEQFKVTLQRLTTALEAMQYKFENRRERVCDANGGHATHGLHGTRGQPI